MSTYWISFVNQLNDWLNESLTYWGIWTLKALEHLSHSKHSGTRGALGHSDTQDTWTLGKLRQSDIRRILWLSDTQGTWAFGLSGNWALGNSKGTWALRHLVSRGNRGTLFSWLNWKSRSFIYLKFLKAIQVK